MNLVRKTIPGLLVRFRIALVLAGNGSALKLASEYNTTPENLWHVADRAQYATRGGKGRSWRLEQAILAFVREQFTKHANVLCFPAEYEARLREIARELGV